MRSELDVAATVSYSHMLEQVVKALQMRSDVGVGAWEVYFDSWQAPLLAHTTLDVAVAG